MSELAEEIREGNAPPVPVPEANPQARAAREKPTISLAAVRAPVTQRARQAGTAAAAAWAHPKSLAHSQPLTFAQARARHHECAEHFTMPALKWARLAWGYFHWIGVKPALNLIEWLTETPARFFPAVLVIVLFWLFT